MGERRECRLVRKGRKGKVSQGRGEARVKGRGEGVDREKMS